MFSNCTNGLKVITISSLLLAATSFVKPDAAVANSISPGVRPLVGGLPLATCSTFYDNRNGQLTATCSHPGTKKVSITSHATLDQVIQNNNGRFVWRDKVVSHPIDGITNNCTKAQVFHRMPSATSYLVGYCRKIDGSWNPTAIHLDPRIFILRGRLIYRW